MTRTTTRRTTRTRTRTMRSEGGQRHRGTAQTQKPANRESANYPFALCLMACHLPERRESSRCECEPKAKGTWLLHREKGNALLAFLFLVSIFNRTKFQFLEFQTQELGRGKFFSCQQCQRVSNQQEHAGTGSHQNPAAAHKGLWWDSATRPLTRTRNSGFWSERPEFP